MTDSAARAEQALRQLVVRYGQSLCEDDRRCEGLLRDFCPECEREIDALTTALRKGVCAELISALAGAVPGEMVVGCLIDQLRRKTSMGEAEACWAVETWAAALGWSSPRRRSRSRGRRSLPSRNQHPRRLMAKLPRRSPRSCIRPRSRRFPGRRLSRRRLGRGPCCWARAPGRPSARV